MTGARSRRRRTRAPGAVGLLLAAPLLLLLFLLLGASPASAHAVLVGSTPPDGSRLAVAPRQVELTFDEAVQLVPGAAKAISASGSRADTGTAHLAGGGRTVDIPLKRDLPRGSYLVTWRVVSADSHIVSGSISFGVGESPRVAGVAGPRTSGLDVVAGVGLGLVYVGVALLIGVLAVTRLLWPAGLATRRVRRVTAAGWVALAAGTVAELLLQGPRAREGGWGSVVHLADLGETLSSRFGVALACRLALLAVALLLVRRPLSSARTTVVASLLAAGVLVTIALGGHASTGADVPADLVVACLHLAAMGIWLGGLVTLTLLLWRPAVAVPDPVVLLSRWSALAFGSVAVLVVSGEYQALRELQPLPALWSTGYGRTLLVKLACVLAAVLAAGLARGAVRRLVAARESSADLLAVVRRCVAAESAALVLVLAVTVVLVSRAPATSTYGPTAHLSARLGDGGHLDVRITPTRRGPQRLVVRAVDADGRPLRLQSLAGHLSSEEVSSIGLQLVRGTDGSWHSVGTDVPLAGLWTATFDVSIDDATGYATDVRYVTW